MDQEKSAEGECETKSKGKKYDSKYGDKRQSNVSVKFRSSKDGRFTMLDITETWIWPVNYFRKILDGTGGTEEAISTKNCHKKSDE